MSRLPYTLELKPESFTTASLDKLISRPFCFFLDSSGPKNNDGRYSYFGVDPVRTFYNYDGFITIDGHTFIEDPIIALKRFEISLKELPYDPYLPFHGGLVGFVGHGWAFKAEKSKRDFEHLPDAWFGLYDTVVTYDHLEKSCWVSSMGIGSEGKPSFDIAVRKCERIAEVLQPTKQKEKGYIVKPLMPDPVSDFEEGKFVTATKRAQKFLQNKEWMRATLAQRFHAPVATDGWSIHKMLRSKNPTPYASFLKCGTFEIMSTSSSCFLDVTREDVTCNAVQKCINIDSNSQQDDLNQLELLYDSTDTDPIVLGEEDSLGQIIDAKPDVSHAFIDTDARSHYLVNRISGPKKIGALATDCLSVAMPGASMTGVPKRPVNNWLRKEEPSRRDIYTGAIGLISRGGVAKFNMASRTMVIKDQVAYIHSGRQIFQKTEPEEVYDTTKKGIVKLFDEIRGLGSI